MQQPANVPNPQRNRQAVEALLARVRNLDQDAKTRLSTMLDEEMDLPYLDTMEREYAKAFQRITPQHAVMLRSRFVQALNDQRHQLVELVRNVLQESEGNPLHNLPSSSL